MLRQPPVETVVPAVLELKVESEIVATEFVPETTRAPPLYPPEDVIVESLRVMSPPST
jgi:hypothetical protein